MHRAATDRPAAVVGAKHERIGAVTDPLLRPEELALMGFIGRETLKRAPPGAGVEGNDRKASLGQAARQCAATRTRADDGKIDSITVGIFPHGNPPADPKHVGSATVLAARDR
jgi:hypothetical protein